MDFYSVNMIWYLLNLTVLTEAEPKSILPNSVNIRPYHCKMSITVLLYSETIYESYMCSNQWSHVQSAYAFSCALLWRVVNSSQFYCLTSRYFFIHNNHELAERLRRWNCKLVSFSCKDLNPTMNKLFCNVHLFHVPRSRTGSVQLKSSLSKTFIRGYRCTEWKIFSKIAAQ